MKKKYLFNTFLSGGGGSNHALTQAWLDRGTALGYTLPTGALLTKLNDFITSAATNIAEADIFYIFRMGDNTLGNIATINIAAPSSNQITVVSGAVYGTGGYAGDATADYLNTNWQPANGIKYTLDDASFIMAKSGTLTGSTQIPCGVMKTTATTSRSRIFWNSNLLRVHVNDVTEVSETGVATETWLGGIRTSSTALGVIQSSGTSSETGTSTQLTPLNWFILGLNLNGALSSPCDGNAEFFAAGSSAMMTGLKTKWDTYVASL